MASFTYDPFGNILPGSTNPANASNASYGFAGPNQKLTETTLSLQPIQMGARVYFPTLGRFAQVDPIEGGTPNNYVYVLDPINGNDYSGLLSVTTYSGWDQGWNGAGSYLQPAATVTVFQAAASAAVVRNVSGAKLQVRGIGSPAAIKTPVRTGNVMGPLAPAVTQKGIFIEKLVWEEKRLKVYPTTMGRRIPGSTAGVIAWIEVLTLAPGASKPGMDDQFFCHWDFVRLRAPNKESWNLDADGRDVSYLETVLQQCNPR
jgi:RHS repeat-associated protein